MKRVRSKGGAIAISRSFQLIFVAVVISSWFIGHLGLITNIVLSDSEMPGSAWRTLGVEIGFMAALLAVGYAFGNYATNLQQLFNATLRALIGLGIYSFLAAIHQQLITTYYLKPGAMPPSWLSSDWSQAALMVLTLGIFAGGQYWWVRQGWRS